MSKFFDETMQGLLEAASENDFVNFKWNNRFNCGEEIINTPITLNGKCVGVVTGVDDSYVYGRGFATALPELNLNENTVVSFEFSESWKR